MQRIVTDVNFDPSAEPKMQAICDKIKEKLAGLTPYLKITTDDNICSSVMIKGSFDPHHTWTNGIYQNSRYFQVCISPPKDKRYYEGEEKITVELFNKSYQLPNMRKYTGPVDKVIEKIINWILAILKEARNNQATSGL